MWNPFKKNEDGLEEYEEIKEKRTTTAGYFLLLLMAVLLITAGEAVFNDLGRLATMPRPPAYCLQNILSSYPSVSYLYDCSFSDTDKRFRLEEIYKQIEPTLQTIKEKTYTLNNLESQISSNTYKIDQDESQYNLSLQEKIAKEEVLFNRSGLQASINSLRSSNKELEIQIANLKIEREKEADKIASQIELLKSGYEDAEKAYEHDTHIYSFKRFGLQLIFVLPFFAIATRKYLGLKKRNSPYTIIATSIMAASAFLMVQILFVFIYEILPKQLLVVFLQLFSSIPLLRYILYYGSILLIVGIFGGLVYYIQKKVFDPRRVGMRRLKENKCPHCSFAINTYQDYCPRCGTQLKEACASCNNKRITGMPFCPICGQKNKPGNTQSA
jgi:hypothetical protein